MTFGGKVSIDGDDVVIRVPRDQVHGLRVALRPIRAGETSATSTKNIRESLLKALAQAEARK